MFRFFLSFQVLQAGRSAPGFCKRDPNNMRAVVVLGGGPAGMNAVEVSAAFRRGASLLSETDLTFSLLKTQAEAGGLHWSHCSREQRIASSYRQGEAQQEPEDRDRKGPATPSEVFPGTGHRAPAWKGFCHFPPPAGARLNRKSFLVCAGSH